ncbi:DMT family transporter [Demequina globuliformis]|uniref:DMT family transporter n=1 Tax=Demequina globuliformis TaxID=676202 RepID=UPI000ACF90A8|nr:DMT family transporter [Demequina globuliformis]
MSRMSLLAATAIAPVLWGTTYLTTTELLPEGRPFTAAVIRALPVGLVLIAWTRQLPRGAWWWKSAVLGALNIGAFFALLFIAAYRLPGGVAATLSAVSPLVVAVLAVSFLHEGHRIRTFAASGIGLAGVAMLVLTPGARLDAWGALAAVAAGTATAVGVVLTKRWGTPTGLVTFTGWQLTWGGIMLVPVALATEGIPGTLSPANIAGFGWLAVAGGLVAYLLWFRGVLALPATQVSLLTFLAPLTATFLGFLVAGQSLTPLQLIGGAVIVAAVIVGQGLFTRPRQHNAVGSADEHNTGSGRRAEAAGLRTPSVARAHRGVAPRHSRIRSAPACDTAPR